MRPHINKLQGVRSGERLPILSVYLVKSIVQENVHPKNPAHPRTTGE